MLGSNVTVRRTSVSVTPGTRVSNLYSLPAVLLSLFAAADPRSLCVYLPFPHSCVHGKHFIRSWVSSRSTGKEGKVHDEQEDASLILFVASA